MTDHPGSIRVLHVDDDPPCPESAAAVLEPEDERVAEAHGWSVRVVESRAGGARFEVTGVAFADDRLLRGASRQPRRRRGGEQQ